MAVVEIVNTARAAVGTFVTKPTKPQALRGYRLRADRINELRDLFLCVESMMGVRTRYWLDVEAAAGIVHGPLGLDEDVELMGPEKWCYARERTLQTVLGRDKELDPLWRARRSLQAIAEMHVVTLWRAYGPNDPNVWGKFPNEVAAIVPFVDVVEELRLKMVDALADERIERARDAAAAADVMYVRERAQRLVEEAKLEAVLAKRAESAERTASVTRRLQAKHARAKGEKQAELALKLAEREAKQAVRGPVAEARQVEMTASLAERRAVRRYGERAAPPQMCRSVREWSERGTRLGADQEVTRAMALSHALKLTEGKTPAQRELAREAQETFIATATEQANDRLIDASVAYRKAWSAQ